MRKFLIPEVVQTSSLDCGPASLKALLEGFNRPVSYGRLREACQTGLDGTSIDTVELVANQLGLEAEQVMLPLDHLLLDSAHALPAIVVVTIGPGITHFVVVWRKLGNWLQVMDPAVGRRWLRAANFLNDVYRHAMPAAAEDWFEYARSADFQNVFRERQHALGIKAPERQYESWRELAADDAALRLTASLVNNGAVRKGRDADRVAKRLAAEPSAIPDRYWSVIAQDDEEVLMRGAVLVKAKGKRAEIGTELGEELSAAIEEKTARPPASLFGPLFKRGLAIAPLLLIALLAAAVGAITEALLFRGLLDVNSTLALTGQRMAAALAVLIFCAALLLLEMPAFLTGARLARLFELRLRTAFLEKLPKLSDRYFQSRPVSDMAERSHILHRMRHVPDQLRQLMLAVSQLAVTAAGIIWLEPKAWPLMFGLLGAAAIPFASSYWLLAERDLRVRTHSGGLMRFYLDSMLGLMPIRTHGAGGSLRRQHSALLDEWTAASFRLQRAMVATEGLQLLLMFGLVAALLLMHPFNGAQVGRVLLMAYWALNMPALGQEIATLARQYPNYRSIALRLLEPLGAPEEETRADVKPFETAPAIECKNVTVVAAGNRILTDVSIEIAAGAHVAIVGSSGAGKSTLVGLLLGWLKAAEGEILIDGKPLDIEQARISATWVDPAVQIWNRSLEANLRYGGESDEVGEAIDSASLRNVLEALPHGLQTKLGENGGLVSGGEGQRVRFGRALARRNAKLVILDEPYRGLDHEKRSELLQKAREYWADATLICVTHDLEDTQAFDQVIVVEGGAVVESGAPGELAANAESRYAQLLASQEQARTRFWESDEWRRVRLHGGRIMEAMPRTRNVEARASEVA